MAKGQSLQDPFLNALRKEQVPVSIYLVNGIKLQGTIESFDQFVVLLRNTVSQMVYKHAISTVVPARNVRVTVDGRGTRLKTSSASSPGITRGRGCSIVRAVANARCCCTVGLNRPLTRGRDSRSSASSRGRRARASSPTSARAASGPIRATSSAAARSKRSRAARGATHADLILVNHALNAGAGAQPREARSRCRVVDRTGLILDIFAQRARSARRQAAGRAGAARAHGHAPGARLDPPGAPARRHRPARPGRDAARDRPPAGRPSAIKQLQERLEKVERQRDADARHARAQRGADRRAGRLHQRRQVDAVQRADRRRPTRPDQLFATLDPTMRQLALERGARSCWPTPSASSATCRTSWSPRSADVTEAREADLLLHVIDAGDPHHDDRRRQVETVLAEIGAAEVPALARVQQGRQSARGLHSRGRRF